MKPKKSLGQNFLINPKVAERIANESNISKEDIVLEIGPGTGNLTKHLISQAKKVLAIEKDDNLFKELEEKFKKEIELGFLVLINDDVLDFDIETHKLKANSYKLIANIPYNITGAILKKFLSSKEQPELMTLMIQKEVAERIIARDGKESLLSISVKAYGEPKILFKVGRGNFFPSPNVDSVIISIKNISKNLFINNKIDENKFWEIIRAGFAHKRKKLSSNLKNFKKDIEKTKIDALKNKRAEELSLTEWINLVKSLDINKKGSKTI